jgi:hypothetical protein
LSNRSTPTSMLRSSSTTATVFVGVDIASPENGGQRGALAKRR